MSSFSFDSTGDLHFGKHKYGKLNVRTGLDTSLLSTFNCFDEFVDHAIKNKVDFVLINGDLAKRKDLSELIRSELLKRIKKLRDEGIDVYILIGNHDLSSAKGTVHNIKSLKVLNISGVNIIDTPTVIGKRKYNLILMPFIEHTEDWIAEYKKLRKKIWGSKKKIVVALHGNVHGIKHHYSELLENDEPDDIPSSIFDDDAIIYVACGHQHEYQTLQEEPVIEYSGSLDRVTFEERDSEKGFVYCRVKGNELKRKFVKVNARNFVQINIDSKKIPDMNYKKAIVKVVLNTEKREFDSYDKEDIQRQLKERGALFVIVKKKSIKQVSVKQRKLTGSVSFKSRIAKWCEDHAPKELNDDVRKRAIEIIDQIG